MDETVETKGTLKRTTENLLGKNTETRYNTPGL
jgi:hypothetical protein